MLRNSGASACGIAKATLLRKEMFFLKQWVEKGYHAGKNYLAENTEKRSDPRKVVDGAQSVIVALFPYVPLKTPQTKSKYKISKYALVNDYHTLIRKLLKPISDFISDQTGSANTRFFSDTGPLLEKAWAAHSGTGWIGKNTLVINKDSGSFHFIGIIVTEAVLEYDSPSYQNCGNCRLCIDSCPVSALEKPFELNINKCISHLTMEKENLLAGASSENFQGYIYGCDICQDVCPWNQKRIIEPHSEFKLNHAIINMSDTEWEQLTPGLFEKLTNDSAINRIGYKVLERNIEFIRSGSQN